MLHQRTKVFCMNNCRMFACSIIQEDVHQHVSVIPQTPLSTYTCTYIPLYLWLVDNGQSWLSFVHSDNSLGVIYAPVYGENQRVGYCSVCVWVSCILWRGGPCPPLYTSSALKRTFHCWPHVTALTTDVHTASNTQEVSTTLQRLNTWNSPPVRQSNQDSTTKCSCPRFNPPWIIRTIIVIIIIIIIITVCDY